MGTSIEHLAVLINFFLTGQRVIQRLISYSPHVLFVVEAFPSAVLSSSWRLQEDTLATLRVPTNVPHSLEPACRVSAEEELGWQVQLVDQLVPPFINVLLGGFLRL